MDLNPRSHHESPTFFLVKTQQLANFPPPPQSYSSSSSSSSSSSGFSNFPILAIALLAIMVTGFLLVSYYIIVIKCCLNWQHLHHPLRRRDRGRPRLEESWLAFSSPATAIHRGLDELVLRDIPTFKYRTTTTAATAKGGSSSSFRSTTSNSNSNKGERSFRGCAVCLSQFEDQEMLRVLPNCGHVFHLDCIDIWLLNNANCPLCRSTISGAKRGPLEHILAPSSSPQEILPPTSSNPQQGTEFAAVEIEEEGRRRRDFQHRGSMMGDECINVRMKDEQFNVNQPIRRSFSMDSAMDGQLLLQVQQIIRQNRRVSNEAVSSSSNGRSSRRSFFSFGQGQGSKSAVLPIQSDI